MGNPKNIRLFYQTLVIFSLSSLYNSPNINVKIIRSAMEKNRLLWACRRGMLELDLILQPFLEQVYPELDDDNKRRFRNLLDCEDQEMFAWFLRRENPRDDEILRIVQLIREHSTGQQ